MNLSLNNKLTYLNCLKKKIQEDTLDPDPDPLNETQEPLLVCVADLALAQNNPNFIKDSLTEWKDCSSTQQIVFKDNDFKQVLLDLAIDTDQNDEISVAEAKQITSLNLDNLSLKNVEKLQSFINLDTLILSNNSISIINY